MVEGANGEMSTRFLMTDNRIAGDPPLTPAATPSNIGDHSRFLAILQRSAQLPPEFRRPMATLSEGTCVFSRAWVDDQERRTEEGGNGCDDVRLLRAVRPYIDKELYAAAIWSEVGAAGWVVADLDYGRVVCWQRYGRGIIGAEEVSNNA